jgi:hypothetical protein
MTQHQHQQLLLGALALLLLAASMSCDMLSCGSHQAP